MAKVGLVGYGYWGPNLTRNFYQMGCLKICCDQDQAKLQRIETLYPKVEVTSDYGMLLKDPDIKGIVIATTGTTHFQLASEALRAGKHVFVEKPMTSTSQQGEELTKLARERGLILMVGHLLLFHPALGMIKGMVDRGEIGKILYLYSQRLNLGKIRKDENALLSLAPHDVSVILYLLDNKEPDVVSCQGESYVQNGIEDTVFGTLHFPDRVMAHMHLSWLDPHKIRKFTIVGDQKMVVFDDMEATEKIKVYDKGVGYNGDYRSYGEDLTLRFGDILVPSVEMTEPLRLECEHFIECIEKDKEPLSGAEIGLKVVRIIEALQLSMQKKGEPIKLKG